MAGKLIEKDGIYDTNRFGKLKVLFIINSRKVRVRFIDTGFECFATSANIRRGEVKDKNKPIVFGVGYYGEGPYNSSKHGKQNPAYKTWVNMLARCYGDYRTYSPSYKGTVVCEEWLNYQNSAEWFFSQDWKNKELDKDLIGSRSKIYSPSTCCFVSHEDNNLSKGKAIRSDNKSGTVGVHYCNFYKKWVASIMREGKTYSSKFNTKEEAIVQRKQYEELLG